MVFENSFTYYLRQMEISNLDFYTRHYYENLQRSNLTLENVISLIKAQITDPRSDLELALFDTQVGEPSQQQINEDKQRKFIELITKFMYADPENPGEVVHKTKFRKYVRDCSLLVNKDTATDERLLNNFIKDFFQQPSIKYENFRNDKLYYMSSERFIGIDNPRHTENNQNTFVFNFLGMGSGDLLPNCNYLSTEMDDFLHIPGCNVFNFAFRISKCLVVIKKLSKFGGKLTLTSKAKRKEKVKFKFVNFLRYVKNDL